MKGRKKKNIKLVKLKNGKRKMKNEYFREEFLREIWEVENRELGEWEEEDQEEEEEEEEDWWPYNPHLNNSDLNNPPSNLLLKCRIKYGLQFKSLYLVEIGLNGNILTKHEIKLPKLPQKKKRVTLELELKYSCNGLLCFVHKTRCNNEVVYITNPTTGEFFMLPKLNLAEQRRSLFYGFGFCIQSNLYKVFRIVTYGHDMYFEIFTIGVDHKWRRSSEDSNFTSRSLSSSRGITLEGVVFFACVHSDRCGIFAFDLEEEKGRLIIPPFRLKTINDWSFWSEYLNLSLCDGYLCLCDRSDKYITVIWTMERFRDAESWFMRAILKKPSDLRYGRLLPIADLGNGDLLMLDEYSDSRSCQSQYLMCYNEYTKKLYRLDDSKEYGNYIFFDYVPNFLPLSPDPLQKYCENIDTSNALDILEIFDACSNQSLKETTLNFIVRNIEDVVLSERYEAFVYEKPHLTAQITRASVMDARNKKSGN